MINNKTPLLSLILNVFNEAKNIEKVFYELTQVLRKANISYQIIFAEGGSTDNSFEVLKKIEKKYPEFVVIIKAKNSPGAKLRAGFKVSKGKYIGFMCSDGQDDVSIIPKCIEVLEKKDADLVKGKRINRENFKRLIISRFYNLFSLALFGTNSMDINGHPKIFPRKILPLLKLKSERESIDLEIFIKFKLLNLKTVEIPVREKNRIEGQSSVDVGTIINFIKDMLSYKWGNKSKFLRNLKQD